MELSPVVNSLINEFTKPEKAGGEGTPITVSRTVSILAVLYEKARNAVEFRAEHLVRRAAIERILKRRIILGDTHRIAESLTTELLWARYIENSHIDEEQVSAIQTIIERYVALKPFLSTTGKSAVSWDSILGLASAEIEETLISGRLRDALNNFFFQAVAPKIQIPGRDDQYVKLQTYIAVERSYAQADDALITFHLLRLILPDWFATAAGAVNAKSSEIISSLAYIQKNLKDPISDSLVRYLKKKLPPFLLIRDFFTEVNGEASKLIADKNALEAKLAEIASRRYGEIGSKVKRAVVRSFLYIFLTKMIFAIALELPFDLYIAKRVSYIPLFINTLFPPVLMAAVAGLISVPGPDNTKRLIDRINKIFYSFDKLSLEQDVFVAKKRTRRPILTAGFSILYLAAFIITFGAIRIALNLLNFNIASQIIFVFFVALVSFFAYRIRQSTKEYEMVEKQGFLEPLFDFFFLPVVLAGRLLSSEIAKLNIFIFLFDFILEAPLKVIFELVEEWVRFVRAKKEEIV